VSVKRAPADGAVFQWTNLNALITAPDVTLGTISRQIRKDAQAYCPVRTGRLRESIHVSSQRGTNKQLWYTIYSHLDYAVYQEYGTRHIAPRAFMGKALANARHRYGSW
jgi:hypothetical protein